MEVILIFVIRNIRSSNIRLIYFEDDQPLVFPQIAKNECAPCANVPHSPLQPIYLAVITLQTPISM